MYKFTNGIVVFDEKTRDAYIKAGMRLADSMKKLIQDAEQTFLEGTSPEKPKGLMSEIEVADENSFNNGTIEEKPKRSNKKSK